MTRYPHRTSPAEAIAWGITLGALLLVIILVIAPAALAVAP